MITHTRQGVRFVTGIGFCVLCGTGGRSCYGHWVLRLVITRTRQEVRFVTVIEFCVLCYLTRDNWYDLLRPLGSASCDITQEAGGTICDGHWVLPLVISHTRPWGTVCYGHWVLPLAISHTRQGVQCVLQALGSASCDITLETGGTICYGHWFLRLICIL